MKHCPNHLKVFQVGCCLANPYIFCRIGCTLHSEKGQQSGDQVRLAVSLQNGVQRTLLCLCLYLGFVQYKPCEINHL